MLVQICIKDIWAKYMDMGTASVKPLQESNFGVFDSKGSKSYSGTDEVQETDGDADQQQAKLQSNLVAVGACLVI